MRTELEFYAYDRRDYCNTIGQLVASIPSDKSIFLLGRYSFDDYYLSFMYQSIKEGNRFYYVIGGQKIEFLTVHKSKGLEADYVILLQCNKDTYGFPSLVSDDPVLNYVLTKSDQFRLSGNFWLVSFKISYLCLPLFYETRTTPSCHPSGCAYRQL